MRTNLHHLIADRARSHPDSPAMAFKQETLDYDALWTQVGAVAAGLSELDVAGEQRIAVFLDNSIETFAAIFGAWASGAAFVLVNPPFRPAQVGHILRDRDVRVLVTSPGRLALMRDELESCPTIDDVVLVGARIEEGEPPAHYRVHGCVRLRGTGERFRPIPGRDEHWRTTELAVWSGDTVVVESDGFLYFVGRKDDMIKTSGYRVRSTEIEEVAYATTLMRDAVVLGAEDATLGQRVLLVVAQTADEFDTDALVEEMKSRLPLYMVPSSVVVHNAISRLPNGEFDRAWLCEELAR
jgi:acyl-CoA synthetase (AMP-forming)/AMP-acid ligase II